MASTNPGPAPRQLGAKDILKRLPAMVQFSLIVFPIVILACLLWFTLGGERTALGLVVLAGVVFVFNAVLAWSHYRKLTHYPATLGRVTGFTNPDDFQTSHLVILHYDFQVDGTVHSGQQNVGTKPNLQIGSPLWVLYNSHRPTDAIPWLD